MTAARSARPGFGGAPRPLAERAGALVLTALVYGGLVALLLLFQTIATSPLKIETRLTALMLPPPARKPPPPVKAKVQPVRKIARHLAPRLSRVPTPPLIPELPAPATIAPLIDLPRISLAETGIGSSGSGTSGQDGTGGQGGGGGGGGATLYDAQWKEQPSLDQLTRYLPRNAPALGWAQVACRTIAQYRVTDCYTLEEFPEGSGFGKTMRDASPDFRVLPPKLNGRELIGSWVALRMNFAFRKR